MTSISSTGTNTCSTQNAAATSWIEPSDEYKRLLKDVTRNRDAVAGERRIKSKGVMYLPPLASMCCTTTYENGNATITTGSCVTQEGMASYNKYLCLAYFYGASGRTVDGLSGLIFTKPGVVDLPESIEYMKNNANSKGDSLRKLSQEAVVETFITPRLGFLVDYPTVEEKVTVAESEARNLRPKILLYKFESIIQMFYEEVNNETKLSYLALIEIVEKRKDFNVECETQYRILEINESNQYQQTVYDEKGDIKEETTVIKVDGSPVDEIPFYPVEVGAEKKSIINDLVDANINHYQFFADYAAKEHASAFPIFYETGTVPNGHNIQIGPGVKWENQNPEATFGVLQTESDGGSMRTYLLDMENRMAALGAEMLKPRIASAESAEAKSLDQVAQNSTVGDVAINVSEALSKALNFAARWTGEADDKAIYKLNTDYNLAKLSGQDLIALWSVTLQGGMSYDTFYENLQKGEVADPKRSAEEEQQLIQMDGMGVNNGAT